MPAGVPALLNPSPFDDEQALLTADSPAIQPTSRVPAWGIYLDGVLAIQADSILKVEHKASARISTAPQEEGSFQAYNKVQAAFSTRVQLTKGGNESERAAFLDTLEAAKQSLDLYDIVMPEKSYLNANLVGYSFQRSARSGVTLLTCELMFEEVRQAAAPVFTQTAAGAVVQSPVVAAKNPSGADPVNAGTKQPVVPTPAQSAPVSERLADAILGAEAVVP
jgi:hypothetical protein